MRLLHVHIITEYKNLKDFKIDFDGSSFIDVFVGKNGTGKSNFFEACLEILKHLFDNEYPIKFNYTIKYKIEEKTVQVTWVNPDWLDAKGKKAKALTGNSLPDNVLIYYSGHNTTIRNFISTNDEKHKEKINRNRNNPNFNQDDARHFFRIGSDYKSLLLAVMLIQSDDINAKKFILDKLGIKALGNEVKIVFGRPEYAKNKEDFTFDEFNNDSRFWGAEGFFRTFLNKIWEVDKLPKTPVREEGYINSKDREEYILFRSLESFQSSFEDTHPLELFVSLDNLISIGMLKDISIEVELNTGKKIDIKQFSDGQFQSIYIFTITELFKDKNCISLLDEPDSFLHPEWQFNFLKQITEISAESSESNHVLMSSHSAVTLIKFIKDRVSYFEIDKAGVIKSNPVPKRVAIDKLSEKLIRYSEHEQLLSIINTIQIENKPVLFTEGKTDPIIIKEAWNRLNPEKEIPFIPFYAFGHKYLVQLMKDPEVIKDMKGLPIFGLFDFDKAYNSWNGFSTNDICTDAYQGLIKKMDDNEVYAIMLPVPNGKPIEQQVINAATGGTYGENSLMAIEHLFCHIPELDPMFVADLSLPSQFKRFQGDKVNFCKNIISTLPDEPFEVFDPIFKFIESKIPQP
ncbi:AAA family ATPase [uncultured Gelidibacter sp.]|uniref:ATP-dependent nuclease n=1 Tax=uncultured Gelidibacter sp. TaxID=259318 RepID=UPI002628A359|nr:AAA family ATPase [uncultured Gelidibacter sp.]